MFVRHPAVRLLVVAILLTACGLARSSSIPIPAQAETPLAQGSDATPMTSNGQVGPTQIPLDGPRTVVRADSGQTLELHVGDTFTLDLGDGGTTWDVQIGDERIVAPVQDSAVPPGTQGVYKALASGWTQLLAAGLPYCVNDDPPCAVMAVGFRLIIEVS